MRSLLFFFASLVLMVVGRAEVLPASGWQATGGASDIATAGAPGAFHFKIAGRGAVAHTVPIATGQNYFVKLRVKSDGEVFVTLGNDLNMAYSTPGQWQTIAGDLHTVAAQVPFTITVTGGTSCDVEGAEVTPIEPIPAPVMPPLSTETTLVQDGKAVAAIVYPANMPRGEELAQQVAAAVGKASGVSLPIMPDDQVRDAKTGFLSEQFKHQPLIVLGRISNNTALWPSYTKFLDATDGYYPGPGGHVVRTAVNVFPGINHIILGGSNDDGVAAAVQRFTELIAAQKPAQNGFAAPYCSDLKLGGACLASFQQEDAAWSKPNPLLIAEPETPGYGVVIRFYANAIAWYWSGLPGYHDRAQHYLQMVLDQDAYITQYPLEFLVRTTQMLAGTGFFTGDQYPRLVKLLARTLQEGPWKEGSWVGIFEPPFDAITLDNRHQIAPWMADLVNARAMREYYGENTQIGQVARFHFAEKSRFFDYLIENRWCATYPGTVSGGHEEEIMQNIYRYALDTESTFFQRGLAKRALQSYLDKINPARGTLVRPPDAAQHELLTGVAADFYRDPVYARLPRMMKSSKPQVGWFAKRYVDDVHEYMPGPEIPSADAAALSRTGVMPFMPHNLHRLTALGLLKGLRPSEVFDFLVMRTGLDPTSDYIGISGADMQVLPNAILMLSSHGVDWFGSTEERSYNANALDVQRLDQPGVTVPSARLGSLRWISDQGPVAGAGITLDPIGTAHWERNIVRLRPGLYLVQDIVRPHASGDYSTTVTWVSSRAMQAVNGGFEAQDGAYHLRISPVGGAVRAAVDDQYDRAWDRHNYYLRFRQEKKMSGGQALRFLTLVEVEPVTEKNWFAASASDDLCRLTRGEESAVVRLGTEVEGTIFGHYYALSSKGADAKERSAALVQAAASLPAASAGGPTVEASQTVPEAPWKVAWRSTDFQKSGRIQTGQTLSNGVVDLGVTYPLVEISYRDRSNDELGQLPDSIKIAPPVPDSNPPQPPPDDSPLWREVGADKKWHPALKTGNYGREQRVEEGFQSVYPDHVEARYVRANGAAKLAYFTSAFPRQNPAIRVTPFASGGGKLFVQSDIWPEYRWLRDEDDAIGVLDGQGHTQFHFDVPSELQAAHALPWKNGSWAFGCLSADARLRVFDEQGKVQLNSDLLAMHQEFATKYKREGNREEAGLYPEPDSFGVWKRGTDGLPEWVIGRYCMFSFLDSAGQLQGMLSGIGYWNPGVLPEGRDFSHNGTQETVGVGVASIMPIYGDDKPYVLDPKGDFYYPQIHHLQMTALPDADGRAGLAGATIEYFDTLAFGADAPRYVLLVREDCAVVYDVTQRRIAWSFVPSISFTSAAMVRDARDELQFVCGSQDGILWTFHFQGDIAKPKITTEVFGHPINSLSASGDKLVIASPEGIFLRGADGAVARISKASAHQAVFFGSNIAASLDGGEIDCLTP